jgi:hypothetical protein
MAALASNQPLPKLHGSTPMRSLVSHKGVILERWLRKLLLFVRQQNS